MKTHKIETKGHNEMIFAKMGRLGYDQDKREYFMQASYIYLSDTMSWGNLVPVFERNSNKNISWKKFLKLPEDNPFKGRKYYVMLDNKKDIDYLLRIAEARGYNVDGSLKYKKYEWRQFIFRTHTERVTANSAEQNDFGTKLTLEQFISGTWPEFATGGIVGSEKQKEGFIKGEYYKARGTIVKCTGKGTSHEYPSFSGVVVSENNKWITGLLQEGESSSEWNRDAFKHLPNYKEEADSNEEWDNLFEELNTLREEGRKIAVAEI